VLQSIGANINEALAGISKKDFTAKMSISSKEARETLYWIKLIQYAKIIDLDFTEIETLNKELIKMLTSIVKTSQLNINK
jgi:four helix bundle protein